MLTCLISFVWFPNFFIIRYVDFKAHSEIHISISLAERMAGIMNKCQNNGFQGPSQNGKKNISFKYSESIK